MSEQTSPSAGKALKCEMSHDCAAPVTHIEEKGFVYCAEHGVRRRNIGRRCRQLRPWELTLLRQSKPLMSYEPISKELDAHMRQSSHSGSAKP